MDKSNSTSTDNVGHAHTTTIPALLSRARYIEFRTSVLEEGLEICEENLNGVRLENKILAAQIHILNDWISSQFGVVLMNKQSTFYKYMSQGSSTSASAEAVDDRDDEIQEIYRDLTHRSGTEGVDKFKDKPRKSVGSGSHRGGHKRNAMQGAKKRKVRSSKRGKNRTEMTYKFHPYQPRAIAPSAPAIQTETMVIASAAINERQRSSRLKAQKARHSHNHSTAQNEADLLTKVVVNQYNQQLHPELTKCLEAQCPPATPSGSNEVLHVDKGQTMELLKRKLATRALVPEKPEMCRIDPNITNLQQWINSQQQTGQQLQQSQCKVDDDWEVESSMTAADYADNIGNGTMGTVTGQNHLKLDTGSTDSTSANSQQLTPPTNPSPTDQLPAASARIVNGYLCTYCGQLMSSMREVDKHVQRIHRVGLQ